MIKIIWSIGLASLILNARVVSFQTGSVSINGKIIRANGEKVKDTAARYFSWNDTINLYLQNTNKDTRYFIKKLVYYTESENGVRSLKKTDVSELGIKYLDSFLDSPTIKIPCQILIDKYKGLSEIKFIVDDILVSTNGGVPHTPSKQEFCYTCDPPFYHRNK